MDFPMLTFVEKFLCVAQQYTHCVQKARVHQNEINAILMNLIDANVSAHCY